MAENSGIAWTDHTFNPWIGCTKVSHGCDHCYAEAWDQRFDNGVHWGPGAPRRRTNVQNWNRVRKWDREAAAAGKRTRVFCASLADVFDNEVPDEWRRDLWLLIAETPNLDWILVTKRVGNVERMAPGIGFPPNVIILSTIVDQAEANRDMGKLARLKRAGVVRKIGVSYEPALGFVDWSQWISDLDWLIVGGESSQGGADSRLFDIDWARYAIKIGLRAGVAVFTKQLGSLCVMDPDEVGNAVAMGARTYRPDGWTRSFVNPADRAGADPSEWPEDLRVRQFPVIGGAQ